MATLTELRKSYGEKLDELEKLAEEGGDAFDTLKKECDTLAGSIQRLEEVQKAKAASAKPIHKGDGTTVPAAPKKPLVKGAKLSRAIVALAVNRGIGRLAAEWAEATWGPDEGAEIARTLAVGTGPTGGFTVPEDFRAELIELLRPASVVYSLQPRVIDMPNGNLTIPRVATGAQAEYVGENTNMLKTSPTFEAIVMTAKKLAALVPMSNDMLRYPSMSADAFVRDDLVAALAQRGDLAMIRSNGSAFSPKGLRQFAQEVPSSANFLTANTTINLVNVTADLARCELALLNSNIPMVRPGWIMSPRTMIFLSTIRDAQGNFAFPEMSQGLLRGKPYRITTQVPDNIGGLSTGSELYLTEFSQFIIGESLTLEIEVTKGGTYHDGSALVSGISQDQTVVSALTGHDTAMRQLRAAVMLNDVRWIP